MDHPCFLFVGTVKLFCKQLFHGFTVKNSQNLGISLSSFSLVYILLIGSVTIIANSQTELRGSEPISIEYKMVHGLNQAVFKT